MKFSPSIVATALFAAGTSAFVPSKTTHAVTRDARSLLVTDSASSTSKNMAFLENLPNPFDNVGSPQVTPRPPESPPPISNEPEALFARARAILASDLGLSDSAILSENFKWVGPNVVSTGALNKDEYIAAGRFFDLRATFPDLDYRAHDFRLDPFDPLTVRFTARTVGTMRGELRLRSETLTPNGVRMVCPPEAISMTFDADTGKLVKLCSGFCMDRLVGNTGGLCGVMAAATVAGAPPSEWEIYPPAAVVSRFFGRSVKQLQEPDKVFLAPFPETVMIQLAKGVLASELGTKDPDLLSDDFTFCGPVVGPLDKDAFIKDYINFAITETFPDLDENYANFRVDPYDPYRVWYDVKATGTRSDNGSRYVGPPEIGSMTFDDDGFCTRLTGGVAMDPTDCNTGGLGGIFGMMYATGGALPALSTRTLPQILARAQKGILSPLTGKDVDDFMDTSAAAPAPKRMPVVRDEPPAPVAQPKPPAPVVPTQNISPKPPAPVVPTQKLTPKPPAPPAPTFVIEEKKSEKKTMPVSKLPKTQEPNISDEPADPVSDIFSNFFVVKQEPARSEAPKKPEPPKAKTIAKTAAPKEDVVEKQRAQLRAAEEERRLKKKEAEETKKQAAVAAAEAKKQAARDAAEAKKQAAEERKQAAVAAVEAKKRAAEEQKQAVEAKKQASIAAAEAKKRAAEEQKQAAEAKKQASIAAAEEKKRVAEEKRRAAEEKKAAAVAANLAKKQEIEEKKAAAQAANKAGETIAKAKRGATISLGFFNFGGSQEERNTVTPTTSSKAPRGVPTLSKWQQNDDDSISGIISGSPSFPEGELITTSPIKTKNPELDSVVVTVSGSKYFLDSSKSKPGFSFFNFGGLGKSPAKVAPDKAASKPGNDAAEQRKKALEEKQAAAAARKAEFEAARQARQDLAAKKKAELEAKKEEAKRKREALVAAQKEKAQAFVAKQKKTKKEADSKGLISRAAGGTVSLDPLQEKPSGFFLFGRKPEANEKKAPAGVPTINRFKKNSDGSITGFITGSANFREGERVTTSKLAPNQKVESGSVVKTVSGSRYFLK